MMWQTQTTIEYPFALRPASIEEAGLFYSQMDEAEDAVLGTVGHIRMDFGASGKEFYHTWWPHNGDQFNTGEFKDELQKFVDMLRADGPLTNLASMRNYCYQHGGKITEDGRCFGYIAETEHYRYCLRCTPSPGEYQGYLYSYDLRQQRMAQQAKPVGRITYAGGEEQTFTDTQKYLDTIREELQYQATTGFRYETLTDDPAVRKAVDDILLDFAGEENPRRGCNYGLTEAGKQALQEAADPDRPHTYAWFVMTDCNIPGEQIYRGLTLEEAIRTYLDSDRPEKRLGVTKDGIATVDLVRSLNGEQHFFTDHLQLDSFKRDPEIAAAVKTLRLELEQNTPQQASFFALPGILFPSILLGNTPAFLPVIQPEMHVPRLLKKVGCNNDCCWCVPFHFCLFNTVLILRIQVACKYHAEVSFVRRRSCDNKRAYI